MPKRDGMQQIAEFQHGDLHRATIPKGVIEKRFDGDEDLAKRTLYALIEDKEEVINWCKNMASDEWCKDLPEDFDWHSFFERMPVFFRATAIRYMDWKIRRQRSGEITSATSELAGPTKFYSAHELLEKRRDAGEEIDLG